MPTAAERAGPPMLQACAQLQMKTAARPLRMRHTTAACSAAVRSCRWMWRPPSSPARLVSLYRGSAGYSRARRRCKPQLGTLGQDLGPQLSSLGPGESVGGASLGPGLSGGGAGLGHPQSPGHGRLPGAPACPGHSGYYGGTMALWHPSMVLDRPKTTLSTGIHII